MPNYQHITDKLKILYPPQADTTLEQIKTLIAKYEIQPPASVLPITEADIVLITYGDQVQENGKNPLAVQHQFLKDTIYPTINSVHILPFFPYSSDDGFSVIDYKVVNPEHGTWDDIMAMGQDFKLMFDAVFNHISAQSDWFQAFLRGEIPYVDYFVVMDKDIDLSEVVRPRALPLLTPVETPDGIKHVWTTFSDDQIDLNIMNPAVLIELIDILLFYVEMGAKLIRLDAIAFLWKIAGTSSIHLEQTHLVIQIMRDVLALVAPDVLIVTETNVPHEENIAYFGNGNNEAHMVYQFPLPPLILHTMTTGDTTHLTQWADKLEPAGNHTTFFNFIASHDGIGLRPVTGILSNEEINQLVDVVQSHDGNVSYKNNSDGTQSPYELNINYFDAVNPPDLVQSSPEIAVRRFIASQSIALCLAGVPGIYIHSLFGSRNFTGGVEETGRYRSINREKLQREVLDAELGDNTSLRSRVFSKFMQLLSIRREQSAFHPLATQVIHTINPSVFVVERANSETNDVIIALTNVTDKHLSIDIPVNNSSWHDVVEQKLYQTSGDSLTIQLYPYQIMWLKLQS